jgi:hypothetical protein
VQELHRDPCNREGNAVTEPLDDNERRLRILEESARRAATWLNSHESRLAKLEEIARVRRHQDRLEERER